MNTVSRQSSQPGELPPCSAALNEAITRFTFAATIPEKVLLDMLKVHHDEVCRDDYDRLLTRFKHLKEDLRDLARQCEKAEKEAVRRMK